MAVLLSELLTETKRLYKMELLVGGDALEVPVSWVHLAEDNAVASYFCGGELVVTTGIGQEGDRWLLTLAKKLIHRHCSGIIVNTGMYIHQISQEVIDFCAGAHLALITMPWEIHLSEVIQDYCMRIVKGMQSDAVISQAIINAIQTPNDEGRYLPVLEDYYNVNGVFQTVAFRLDFPEGTDSHQRMRTGEILRTLLSRSVQRFSLLRLDNFYLLVFNDPEEALIQTAAEQLINRCGSSPLLPYPVHVGIGSPITGIRRLGKSYRRARAAARMADYFNRALVDFQDMGIYQILLTVEDPDVLEGFCVDNLGVLLDYDRRHNTCLTETLYYHLKLDGSVKAMAEAMYTHRNTINYRISKLRELLNSDLTDTGQRARYWLAFCIRDTLEEMKRSTKRGSHSD